MCEYCSERNILINARGDISDAAITVDSDEQEMLVDFYDNNGANYQIWFPILYCPICGRKLKNEA